MKTFNKDFVTCKIPTTATSESMNAISSKENFKCNII